MDESIRVELPLGKKAKLFSTCKSIGDLKKMFPKIQVLKYIYVDPVDNKLKGANPPDELPLVEGAYISIIGSYDDVIEFMQEATTN